MWCVIGLRCVVCGLWFGVVCGVVVGVLCVWRFRIVPMADCVGRKGQSGGVCGWSGTSAK